MNDSNDEFAWPAFVDVLTTMTMILTFVMLILAGAVGSLTQSATRNVIDSFNIVAKEKGTPSISAEMPKQKIIAAIREMQSQALAKPAENVQTSAPQALSKPGEKMAVQEKQISIKAAPKAVVDRDVKVDSAPSLVTLNYPKRQTRLDSGADKNLKEFLKLSQDILNAKEIEVHAFAPASAGSLTEARRIAYYRAMLIRMRLIAEGVAQDKIRLQVDDQFSDADGDKVKIFAR